MNDWHFEPNQRFTVYPRVTWKITTADSLNAHNKPASEDLPQSYMKEYYSTLFKRTQHSAESFLFSTHNDWQAQYTSLFIFKQSRKLFFLLEDTLSLTLYLWRVHKHIIYVYITVFRKNYIYIYNVCDGILCYSDR